MTPSVVFSTSEFNALEARQDDVLELQALAEANPEYWLITRGHAPSADFAAQWFERSPPDGMSFSENLHLLVRDATSAKLIGLIDVATDLLVVGVYHLGYFMTATQTHGSGLARRLYQAYEHWAQQRGARWLRLGVFQANQRAEALWRRMGYAELRRQDDYAFGDLTHVLITMLKPLSDATVSGYLEAVPRDRPN